MPSSEPYFQRFGFCERQIPSPPQSDLGIVVVIPCFNEPDLLGSLESLWACDRPGCAVEIIVVVNSPAGSSAEIRRQNQMTLEQASAWARTRVAPRMSFQFLHFPELPVKHAGVGLARKIGMDEAVRRFDDLGKSREGIIVGYDADCRCARNYLSAIERHFHSHPNAPGCSLYFEHPLDGPLDPNLYAAVAAYELHLRYYVQALRHAGFPYACHTLGSCMAVRAEVYQRQGGMNKRQAGEDFYFLHKILPLGGFTDLTETTVVPSPRASDRVPFGTGQAVGGFLRGEKIAAYPLQAFLDLKLLFEQIPAWYRGPEDSGARPTAVLPECLKTFLAARHFAGALQEIRGNTSSEAAFRKRFFGWFNGFRAMKFVHHAQDNFYGEGALDQEAGRLLELLPGGERMTGPSLRELLARYRLLDKGG